MAGNPRVANAAGYPGTDTHPDTRQYIGQGVFYRTTSRKFQNAVNATRSPKLA